MPEPGEFLYAGFSVFFTPLLFAVGLTYETVTQPNAQMAYIFLIWWGTLFGLLVFAFNLGLSLVVVMGLFCVAVYHQATNKNAEENVIVSMFWYHVALLVGAVAKPMLPF